MNPASATAITNPFPGLRPFLESEEHLFFGREHQVDAMVNKLAQRRFLAVVGSSGSGKSSLVNCGLRPALHQGRMASAGTNWRMAQFRPGNHPLAAMAKALAEDGVLFRNFEERGLPLVDIIDTTLRMSKRGLIDIVEQAALAKDVNVLVVVDQFEELFRYRQLVDGPQAGALQVDGHGFSEEATAFVKLLLELQEQKDCPIYVVLTMRSDFLGDCTQFAGLAEAINAGLYLVPRLTPEERRDAIVNPIRVQGAEIEPVLVTRLVNDVGDNPDQLSILQHALNRTWANWQEEGGKCPLALRHYEAIGTMEHALDIDAEKAYAEVATSGQLLSQRQRICEKLFQALTDKATDGRGIRRPTTLGSLCALTEATESEVVEVIEVFRHPSRSFLMPPAGEPLTKEKVIDISHESLMRVWQRLKRWVEQEAQAAQIYRRLAESSFLHAEGKANTLRDPELTIYQNWQLKRQPNKAWAERYAAGFDGAMAFLQRSVAERDVERAEKERRLKEETRRDLDAANRARLAAEDRQRLLRRGLIGMGALALMAAAAGSFAWWQLQQARLATARAFAATARAQLSSDPFDALVNGLAASGRLASVPGEAFEVLENLAKAVKENWQVDRITTGQGKVWTLVELNNGELISGGGEDSTLQRWRDGKASGPPIPTGQSGVLSLVELKSGELISGGRDGTLRRWRNGKAIGAPIQTNQAEIWSLVELKNGELISGGKKGTLQRWRDGKAISAPIQTSQGEIWRLVELKNGELISGGSDGSLRRWREDKEIGAPIQTEHGGVLSLLQLKKGDLISGGHRGSLRRWRDGRAMSPLIKTNQGGVLSLIELKNGELISGGSDGSLRRWRDDKPIGTNIPTGQREVWSLEELENGELVSGGSDGSLKRWRRGPAIGAPIETGQGGVLSLIENKNGELISGGRDGSLRRWRDNQPLGAPIATGQGGVWSLVELKSGELISGGSDGSLRRWRDGKAIGGPIKTGQGDVWTLVEMKSGELISGGSNGDLRRWRDGRLIGAPIKTGPQKVRRFFKLKSGELISAGEDGSLQRWRDGKAISAPIKTSQGEIWSLVELKNGELISGGNDGSLRRWRNGKAIGAPINTKQGKVLSLLELQNGILISGGSDGKIQRWRNFNRLGEPIKTSLDEVSRLVELKNGGLVIGGSDETLRRWNGKEVIKAACQELREHPALKTPQTASEFEASRTCRNLGYLR